MKRNTRRIDGRDRRTAWRLLDTGRMSAAENIAVDAVLLSLRARNAIPDTFRLLAFSRPAALIGFNQSPDAELRLDYCESRGIEINRRITGGGAIYLDQGQLGWELIASRSSLPTGPSMAAVTEFACDTAAKALSMLGVNAAFRPRNDIDVGGRKICGTGGAWEGDTLLFQGTLLVEFEPEAMIKSLRIPTEKLLPREISSVRERVTSLSEQLEVVPSGKQLRQAFSDAFQEALEADFFRAGLTVEEEAELERSLPLYSSTEWLWQEGRSPQQGLILRSVHRGEGGTIRVSAAVDRERSIIKSVHFRGDYFVSPPRAAFDLEAFLKHCPFDLYGERLDSFFSDGDREFMGLGAGDFGRALKGALAKLFFMEQGIGAAGVDAITLVGSLDARQVLERASVLLLPYCAKAIDCQYRSLDDCDQCGDCEVGDAYAMAFEHGLEVVSINDYKHLVYTLDRIRGEGAEAYIGCCCHAFMVKRYRTLDAAGISGLLVDIGDTTCYDLSREQDAYAGDFDSKTRLMTGLLRQLLDLRPAAELTAPAPDAGTGEAEGHGG